MNPSAQQKWKFNPNLYKYVLWYQNEFALGDKIYLFFASIPLHLITYFLWDLSICRNIFRPCHLPLIHVLTWMNWWWIGDELVMNPIQPSPDFHVLPCSCLWPSTVCPQPPSTSWCSSPAVTFFSSLCHCSCPELLFLQLISPCSSSTRQNLSSLPPSDSWSSYPASLSFSSHPCA